MLNNRQSKLKLLLFPHFTYHFLQVRANFFNECSQITIYSYKNQYMSLKQFLLLNLKEFKKINLIPFLLRFFTFFLSSRCPFILKIEYFIDLQSTNFFFFEKILVVGKFGIYTKQSFPPTVIAVAFGRAVHSSVRYHYISSPPSSFDSLHNQPL